MPNGLFLTEVCIIVPEKGIEEKTLFCKNAITEKKYINREALRSARMERKAEYSKRSKNTEMEGG